jgi:tetratricopeptide (TPR) repeat protein
LYILKLRRRLEGITLLSSFFVFCGTSVVPEQLALAQSGNVQEDATSGSEEKAQFYEWRQFTDEVDRLYRTGKFQAAQPLAERALRIAEATFGSEHLDTATSLSNLAELYRSMAVYAKAEPLHTRALAIREKALGPDHPDVANSLSNLAVVYYLMSLYAKAEPLFTRALAIREKVLEPEHPATATNLNNLGELYRSMGDYVKAEPLYVRALAIREKILGPEHPNVATSLNNLAVLYHSMGVYAKAEPLYVRAVRIREKVLGPDHPNVANSLNNLAELYRSMGVYAKAEPLYVRALAILEKILGPEHPDIATCLNNLGALYVSRGRYNEALPLSQRALQTVLSAKSPDVLASVAENLARLYGYRQESEAAIFYYKLAVNTSQTLRSGATGLDQVLQQSLAERVGPRYRDLARLLIDKGRIAEAEQVLDMLKEYEHFEFVRRDATNDPRQTQASLTEEEHELMMQLNDNAQRMSTIFVEIEPLRKLGERSAEQEASYQRLREDLNAASEQFATLFTKVEQQLALSGLRTGSDLAKEAIETRATLRDSLAWLQEQSGVRAGLLTCCPAKTIRHLF